jgi:hypothetical protein
MTKVFYNCKDAEGNDYVVTTLAEARAFKEKGGSYKIGYDYTPSRDNAYARKDARIAPFAHERR